jgi:hypothetical protein
MFRQLDPFPSSGEEVVGHQLGWVYQKLAHLKMWTDTALMFFRITDDEQNP